MEQTLYFAYGANTNVNGMDYRCPNALPVGRAKLAEHRLVFRGVADVVPDRRTAVQGVLWVLTPECEAALDRFEGFPNLYIKKVVRVMIESGEAEGVEVDAMVYVMRAPRGEAPPHEGYEKTLRSGYRAFGCDTRQIDRAIARSYSGLVRERNGSRWSTPRRGAFIW